MSDYSETEDEKVEFAKEILYTQGSVLSRLLPPLSRSLIPKLPSQPSSEASSAGRGTCSKR